MNDGEVLKAIGQLKTDLIGHIDKSGAKQKTEFLDHIAKLKTDLLAHIDRSEAKLRTDLLDQIHGVGAQLHAQIEDLEKRMDDRQVAIEARLKLHGGPGRRAPRVDAQSGSPGLVQAGSRAIARIIEWTESTDTNLFQYHRLLSEFEKRLADLERKSA
jgi:hypothetical protein